MKQPDRVIRVKDHEARLKEAAKECSEEEMENFQEILKGLRDQINNKEEVKEKLVKTLERNTFADRGEFTTGHYIHTLLHP